MKNKIKYFVLYPLILLMVILIFTFNVNELISLGHRIPFGSSYWKDSLSDAISTNKSIKLGTGDSLYYNGVVVTSGTGGGGIAASDNISFSGVNTFTHKNTFSDTLKADGLSLIDNARITSDLNVTGDVISDLNFLKGSSTSIGTISTDSLAFITANTKRIIINKNGYTNFTDTVQMSDYVQIIGNLNVGTDITALGKVTADSLLGVGYYITDINAANIASGKIDSARIPNTAKIDTANFAHTGSGITEIFNSIVTFATTVTFTVSPVFSALVNFANGISTTTLTASGTATFNGYNIYGDSTGGKSLKFCEVKGKIGTGTSQNYTFALPSHLLGNGYKRVVSWTCNVRNDSATSTGRENIAPYSWYSTFAYYAAIDSANCIVGLPAASNIINDSVFFAIWYRSNGSAGE